MRAHEGDMQAREELVEENMALVRFLVKRFAGRGADSEDLFQYGCMGLLKAIDRFDPEYSVQFSTYAVPVILGEIRRYLRDDGPIHVSRTIHDNARRVEQFCAEWREKYSAEPNVSDVADGLEMSREDVLLALNARNRVRSLSEPIGGDGDLRLMDVLGTEPMRDIDSRLTLAKLLRDLPDEERTLIVRRYFKSHTQTEIARDMGVSQVQVSRMESRIIKKMRKIAGED
ncbi:MAG: SigB/SigF/SigG family RNA polymerase sigma factor [Candidatus Faecivicinus sp.]